jgi:hypothetical protein
VAPVVPVVPCGPVSPFGPCCPCGPVGPVGPADLAGPAGPAAPLGPELLPALVDEGEPVAARRAYRHGSAGREPYSSRSSSSAETRPYWSGIQPQPQVATGRLGNGPGPYSSRGSTLSGSTRQRCCQPSPKS